VEQPWFGISVSLRSNKELKKRFMKAKSILAAAFVLISSVAFASGPNDNKLVVVRVQESGVFKVIFEGKDQVKATVNILDISGNLVYSTSIQGKNGFILPLNFSELTPGSYSIEVVSGSNVWAQSVVYSKTEKESPVQAEKNSTIQYVHLAKLENDGRFLLSIVKTGYEVVTIDIYDTKNDLVHSETRKTDGDMAVIYDVKELLGSAKFHITDKSGYSKTIKK
jgi:hypothetical protein